jgi:hypothetical protein
MAGGVDYKQCEAIQISLGGYSLRVEIVEHSLKHFQEHLLQRSLLNPLL